MYSIKPIEELRIKLKETKIGKFHLDEILPTLALIIVIPSFVFQILKLLKTQSAKDYSLYFILLQLIGTPEGGGALITGIFAKNIQLGVMGGFGLLYYCIALYFYLFSKK